MIDRRPVRVNDRFFELLDNQLENDDGSIVLLSVQLDLDARW